MRERDMQTLFGRYIEKYPPEETEAYELKFTSGKSLNFSEVKEHQIEALLKAEDEAFYHRITDQPWLPDRKYSYTLKKPFDCFCLTGVKSYIVIWFYKPRQPKVFIKIPIKKFLRTAINCNRKSLTKEMALQIGQPLAIN